MKKLDIVSKVTVRIFVGQVVLATILAIPSPMGFSQTFTVILLILAIIQTMLALSAESPPAPSLSFTEWDGISWLLLVAMGWCILTRL